MSAATESIWRVAVGDVVFVSPDDERTPAQLRGCNGTVVALDGTAAQLEVSTGGRFVWVNASDVRLDRRRKRLPVKWELPS